MLNGVGIRFPFLVCLQVHTGNPDATSFANGSIALEELPDYSVSWLTGDGLNVGMGFILSDLEAGTYVASLEDPADWRTIVGVRWCDDAQDWPNDATGFILGLCQEWVLRVPEVVDAGVNFVVSHFELDSSSCWRIVGFLNQYYAFPSRNADRSW